MSYSKDREDFIATMVAEGLNADCARTILRHAATLQRLAEEECNTGRVDGRLVNRHEEAIRLICANAYVEPGKRFEATFQGDPRGAVVKLKVPSGRTNDWGQTGICVPTR